MKELNSCRSNNPVKKHKAKSKKHKPSFNYFVKNSWPKVMISRDNVIYKKVKSNSFRGQSSSKPRAGEEKVDLKRCDENEAKFEEEHSVCLISSSSEIQESHDMCETFVKTEDSLEAYDEPIRKDDFNCTSNGSAVSGTGDRSKPVSVEATTEKKNAWKHSLLKRYRNVRKNAVNEKNSGSEPRVVEDVLADSSSKSKCDKMEGPATALRSRGPYLIPMQPNHSLPIRPAPSVPTRSFQKKFSRSLILPKFITRHTVEEKSVKSSSTSLGDEVLKGADLNSEKRTTLNESVNSMDYVVPQISSVETIVVVQRRRNSDSVHDKDNSIKTHMKKRRSLEADSSQNKVDNSTNQFLTNFRPSMNEKMQNQYANKSTAAASVSTKEEIRNKLVPPLRLKKIARTRKNETAEPTDSQVTAEPEQETNYRIIRERTPEQSSSPTSVNNDDMFYETETDLASLNTDRHKLKYRRNKLKEKLGELRGKALELSKQMANEPDSQQNTSLRQVMNRYEKQIENLSKLHSKLSAAIPSNEEAINKDDNGSSDKECANTNLKKVDEESLNNNLPVPSPGPPKLSPLCFEDMTEEIPNSPPMLAKVCSSGQDTKDEVKISKTKPWFKDSKKRSDNVNGNTSSCEASVKSVPGQPNTRNTDFCTNRTSLDTNGEGTDLSDNENKSPPAWKEANENDKLIDELLQCHDMIEKAEEIKPQEFFNSGPVIKSVSAGVELPMPIEEGQAFVKSNERLPSSAENTLVNDSCESNQPNSAYSKINDDTNNPQNVTSSSGHPPQFNVPPMVLKQDYPKYQQSCETVDEPNDSMPKTDNPPITEQFPTLSNWLAGMSRKQSSPMKSTSKPTGNPPFATTDTKHTRVAGSVVPMVGPSVNNDLMNTAAPQGTDRYHSQRQPLFINTSPMALRQPVAAVPPLRPAIYPVPMPQFYNYPIDPYNNAPMNYHPPMYPYANYPYNPRLHSNTPPRYHIPMQEGLRPLQQMDKRFPSSSQEPVLRYTPPTMNTVQHPNNLEFDRLRSSCAVNNIRTTNYLPPIFSSQSSNPPMLRDSTVNYASNNQFSGNRMMPDVVAAAAAAAVVAAASIDRQYNRNDMLPASSIANTVGERSFNEPGPSKPAIINQPTNIAANQVQDNTEEIQKNMQYKNQQNVPFDRLTAKTTENFVQPHSSVTNDNPPIAPIYQTLLKPVYTHLPRNVPGNEARSAGTPHLGKMTRSPSSVYKLVCSNCGVPGPMFKCLGCEITYYCNERCQENHWHEHVQTCPKSMPKLKKLM